MNRMKITFGIMSNKYQIEAYNKLDAYAAMAIFFKRDLPYVLLFEPYEIIKDNFIERINKEFLIKENMDTTWTNLRDKLPEYYCNCLIKSVENLTLVQRFYVVSCDLEMRQFYHRINDNIFNDSTFEIDDNHEYYYIVIPD